MLDVCARDRADRLSPEPGKDLVLQTTAIDFEGAWLAMPGLQVEDGVRDVLERGLCGDLRRARLVARPAGGQIRPRKIPRIGQGHRAGIADGLPRASAVGLRVDEEPLATGWQDPDAEAA